MRKAHSNSVICAMQRVPGFSLAFVSEGWRRSPPPSSPVKGLHLLCGALGIRHMMSAGRVLSTLSGRSLHPTEQAILLNVRHGPDAMLACPPRGIKEGASGLPLRHT
jgi:hypothetical protein